MISLSASYPLVITPKLIDGKIQEFPEQKPVEIPEGTTAEEANLLRVCQVQKVRKIAIQSLQKSQKENRDYFLKLCNCYLAVWYEIEHLNYKLSWNTYNRFHYLNTKILDIQAKVERIMKAPEMSPFFAKYKDLSCRANKILQKEPPPAGEYQDFCRRKDFFPLEGLVFWYSQKRTFTSGVNITISSIQNRVTSFMEQNDYSIETLKRRDRFLGENVEALLEGTFLPHRPKSASI